MEKQSTRLCDVVIRECRAHTHTHTHTPVIVMLTDYHVHARGVVVNFDLGERFPRSRSQQRGSLRPHARRVAVLGGGCGRGSPPPPENVLRFLMPNPAFGGQFGPENKLIEGQPNEYDVICRNASVLAFHLWPTIFAAALFRLQNICRYGVPPRSRTTTPLVHAK